MGKVIEVIRESSEGQHDGAGPETQKKDLDNHIANDWRFKDYEVVVKPFTQSTTYTDYDARKDYQEILSFLKKEDILAFADSSRFSRNVTPAVEFISVVRYSVQCKYMIVANRTFDLFNETDFSDLIKIMADEHRTSRAWFKKGKDGKKEWRDKGYYSGGKKTFGYSYSRVRVGEKFRTVFVIQKEQAEIVVLIFTLYLEGKSSTDITIELNKRGEKSPEGTQWCAATIQKMLKRKKFCGIKDKDGNMICPPIIDEATFKEVERLRIKNAKRGMSKKPKYIFPLRDQLQCGCGQRIQYHPFISRGRKIGHRFYCPHHFPKREEVNKWERLNKGAFIKCPVYLRAEDVVDYVWDKIAPLLTEPNKLRQVITKYLDSCLVNKVEIELAIAERQKNFSKIEARWKKAKYQFREDDISDKEYAEQKRFYFEAKVHLEKEISSLQDKLTVDKKINDRVAEIEKALPFFKDALANLDWDKKAWWLSLLVEEVVITDRSLITDRCPSDALDSTSKGYEIMIHGSLEKILDGWLEYFKNNKIYIGDVYSELHTVSIPKR
ncbi:MAG: recombinase family protein [Candidatus Omnitrophota bacterium]